MGSLFYASGRKHPLNSENANDYIKLVVEDSGFVVPIKILFK